VRIDGRGKWLVPGLADMHVHLFSRSDLDLYLANGVTTVRNLGGYGAADSILEIRREIEAGELRGPTIVTSGNWLDGDPPYRDINTIVRTPEEGRLEVERQHRAGYDFIKVYEGLTPEVYGAIHEELRRLVEPGLTPREALRAATAAPAEYLAEVLPDLEPFGTIEVGRRADLILLDADPLADVANLEQPAGVMARGAWFPASELLAMLDAAAR
jgi:imidazolonepropionase-like amidohydrolase